MSPLLLTIFHFRSCLLKCCFDVAVVVDVAVETVAVAVEFVVSVVASQ